MSGADSEARINDIVNKLCDEYKSHSYPICRKEARLIGLKVTDAPPNVDSAMMDLLKFYLSRDIGLPKTGGRPSQGQKFKLYIAWLDSVDKQMRVEQDALVDKDETLKPMGDRWVLY
jgi:hypothetical protein